MTFFQDQSGKMIELPKDERRAIIIAMSLHEKGKSAIKKGNYGLAMILLLEAKDEYNSCRSELLKAVDNYGENQIICLYSQLLFTY
jgi:hypothetical protein